uniref:Chitin-binding type-4 domain-containing protein n=1 Tax=viral metagenome TaxID=1070528 RepID=A0A6C0E1M3_9ZZZZ
MRATNYTCNYKLQVTFAILNFINFVSSHIFMQSPPSRRNKYSEYYKSNDMIDYNLMAPLNTPGYSFPCKGYKKGPSTQTITGGVVKIVLEGTATHEGGHCQFGVSFDDNTFVVLKTVMDSCLLNGLQFDLQLPENIPSGDVTMFWTWVNKIGNREYYMECADVFVENKNEIVENGNKEKKVVITGLELLVVNLPGYPVIPEFRSPGMYNGKDLFDGRKSISVTSGLNESVKGDSNNTYDKFSNVPSYNEHKDEPHQKSHEIKDLVPTDSSSDSSYSTDSIIERVNGRSTCATGEMECDKGNVYLCINNNWTLRECDNGGECVLDKENKAAKCVYQQCLNN